MCQGEILENMVQIITSVESLTHSDADTLEVLPVTHELVIVMSQDCDLEQDFKRRQTGGEPTLPNILFCDVWTAETLRLKVEQLDQLGRKDWKKRIAQNQNERFHYLQKVAPGEDHRGTGLTATAIDFKIYFTMPTGELYARLATGEARHRCVLNSPYAEHLAHRFFRFQARVALPRDHEVDPLPD